MGMAGGGVPGPIDPATTRLVVHRGDDAERQVAERAARRGPPSGPSVLQRFFVWVGVAVGFLLLVVPGVLMLRRVRAWRRGEVSSPGVAGPLGALVFWGGAAVALWTVGWGIAGVLAFVLAAPASAIVAARG